MTSWQGAFLESIAEELKNIREILEKQQSIEVGEDCISLEDIGKTLNEWLDDKEMARFATKILRLNAPRVVPTTKQSSIVHCKDCKHWNGKYCFNKSACVPKAPKEKDFCSWGERRGE